MLYKIDKLLAREIIPLTFILTAAITSILIVLKIPKYLDFLFSAPEMFSSILILLLYILPSVLKLTLPISLLLSCAIVIMRMSADRELEAFMACGLSVFRLSLMPSIIGIIITSLSLFSAMFFEPYTNKQFERFNWLQGKHLAETFLKNNLQAKTFITDLSQEMPITKNNMTNFMLYFDSIDALKNRMQRVYISFIQANQPYSSYIIANNATLSPEIIDGYPDYIFSLNNGIIYGYMQNSPNISNYPPSANWNITKFESLKLSLVSIFKDKFKLRPSEPNRKEFLYPQEYFAMFQRKKMQCLNWRRNAEIIDIMLFFFKQLCTPLTSFFLPIIGICLGIADPRKKQLSIYLGVGIVIFALYAALSISQELIVKFLIPPYTIMFIIPAMLTAILLILLRWRCVYPPSCSFLEFLKNDCKKLW